MRSVRRSPGVAADTARGEAAARPADPTCGEAVALIALTYELLDAHADTARLVGDEASDAEWQSHLAYLRDLQRVGRGTLARAAIER
jgi:hypothetical protein